MTQQSGKSEPVREGIASAVLRGLRQALSAGLSGYIVSVLLSLAIVAGLFLQLEPFKAIERFGVDISFRLLSSRVAEGEEQDQSDARPKTAESRFVFFDVDRNACRELATEAGCATRNPVGPEAVRALLPALMKSDASAIIIDSALDLRNQADEQLLREIIAFSLAKPDGPRIILPIELRNVNPDGPLRNNVTTYTVSNPQLSDPAWLEQSGILRSRVRLVPAIITTDIEAGDGKVRNVQRTLRINFPDKARILPNLPYLLSLPGNELSWTEIDCIYFSLCPKNYQPSAQAKAYRIPPVGNAPARIMFTIPALSQIPAGACDKPEVDSKFSDLCKARATFQDRYIREPVSSYLSKSTFSYPSEQLAGTTVIVGSSLPSGNDLHLTPTDVMSGPEVIVNAASTFRRFNALSTIPDKPMSLSDASVAFQKKIANALPAALIITFSYFILNLIRTYTERTTTGIIARRIMLWTSSLIILSAALYFSLNNEITEILKELQEQHKDGLIIDTITPIAILLLEKYAELLKSLISVVERATHLGVERLSDALGKIGRKSSQDVKRREIK